MTVLLLSDEMIALEKAYLESKMNSNNIDVILHLLVFPVCVIYFTNINVANVIILLAVGLTAAYIGLKFLSVKGDFNWRKFACAYNMLVIMSLACVSGYSYFLVVTSE